MKENAGQETKEGHGEDIWQLALIPETVLREASELAEKATSVPSARIRDMVTFGYSTATEKEMEAYRTMRCYIFSIVVNLTWRFDGLLQEMIQIQDEP